MKRVLILLVSLNLILTLNAQIDWEQLATTMQTIIDNKLNKSDTSQLLAKRDTAQFALNIKNSIVANEVGWYSMSTINTTTTLTATSPEHIVTFGTISITLPSPSSCFNNGKSRRFIITKGDLGISTLTILNESSSTIAATANKGTTYFFITNGSTWIQCDRN